MPTTSRADPDGGRLGSARLRAGVWWRNLPLRRKVMAVPVVALVLSLPVIVVAVMVNRQVDEARSESRATDELLDEVNGLSDAIAGSHAAGFLFSISLFLDDEQAEEMRSRTAEARAAEARLERIVPDDLQQQMQEVSGALDTHLASIDATLDLAPDPGEPPPSLDAGLLDMFAGAIGAAGEVRSRTADLRTAVSEQLAAQRRDVALLEDRFTRAVIASWAVMFVAVAASAALVTNDVLRRVERLNENGRRFVNGEDLLPLKPSDDEIGQLVGGMMAVGGLLEQRRQEAIAATRLRDELLSRISGELRRPLSGIMERGESLEASEDLPPDHRSAAHHVVRGGDHLLSLINDLLDISRIETGDLSVSLAAVPLHEVADDALALVQPRAEAQSLTVAADVPRDLVVSADRRRLQQVLLNLLTNAVKYNRPGGHVQLTARSRDGTVAIAVSDTGNGIAEDDLTRLFRPFERLGAAGSGVEGSGIGLALARNLAEAMGGSIGVESEVGRGSTFRVELLAAPDGTAPGEAVAVPRTRDAPGDDRSGGVDGGGTDPVALEAGLPPVHGDRPGRRRRRRLRDRWEDMRVRRKVLAVVVAALLISSPAVALTVMREVRLGEINASRQSTQEFVDDLNRLQDVSIDATDAVLLFGIRIYRDEEHLDAFRRAEGEAMDLVARLTASAPDELEGRTHQAAVAVEDQVSTLEALVEQGIELVETGDVGPDVEVEDLDQEDVTYGLDVLVETMVTANAREADTREATGDLRAEAEALLSDQSREVEDLAGLVTNAVLVSWLVTIVAVTAGAGLLIANVVRRVELLQENGRRLVAGESLLPLKQSNDEIGRLIDGMIAVGGLIVIGRQEAIEATRRRDEFLSRISHELRTPLTAIIGFGELLEDAADSPGDRAAARHITHNGEVLLDLITDLLDLSKLETGRLALQTEAVPLHEVTDQAVVGVRPQADGRSVALATDVPADLVVSADRQRLVQVLVNLLSDAVSRNHPSSAVHLAATGQGGTVRVVISGSDDGIPADEVEHFFEPFLHPETAGARGDGGGVELALAKNLTDAMGGTVSVASEAGRGTTFTLNLPVPGTEAGPSVRATQRTERDEGDPVVLYAGTGLVDSTRLEAAFQDREERLEIQNEGRGVAGMARLLRPKLILLASDLPDVDAETVLRQLKAAPDTAQIPVIVLVAEPTPTDVDLLLARGARSVLARPLNTAQLTRAIDGL